MKNTVIPHQHGDKKLETFILNSLPEEENFEAASNIFKLLDDRNRLLVFFTLCHVEECVINLSAMLNISSPALSHHLKILKSGGLIESRRDGKEVYYKIANTTEAKTIHTTVEQIMMISCPRHQKNACNDFDSQAVGEQEKIIKEIHDYLSENLEKRITIEQLSHKFLMNSTTIKTKFKDIYGSSIAAHIKEHRMEKAAELLSNTDFSVSEISEQIGYTSKSKFSSVFSEAFGMTPLEYRKINKHY